MTRVDLLSTSHKGVSPIEDQATSAVVQRDLNALDETDKLCAGVSSNAIQHRGELLRRAAMLGDTGAQVCYALSPFDPAPDYLTDSWFDYAARWKTEAPDFAFEAFAEGEPRAIPLLIEAFASPSPDFERIDPITELIGPDPVKAYGLSLLQEKLESAPDENLERQSALLKVGLDAGQQAKARQLADTWWPKFANKVESASASEPCGTDRSAR